MTYFLFTAAIGSGRMKMDGDALARLHDICILPCRVAMSCVMPKLSSSAAPVSSNSERSEDKYAEDTWREFLKTGRREWQCGKAEEV